MERVRCKLRDNQGMSMVIAMLYLLLCVTVGTVVLTMAVNASGRTDLARDGHRNYLAVSSAARLLAEDLESLTYTGAYGYHGSEGTEAAYESMIPEDALSGSRILGEHLKHDFDRLYLSTLPEETGLQVFAHEMIYPLEFAAMPEYHLPEVKGVLNVETVGRDHPVYTIQITLWTEERDGDKLEMMTLTAKPVITESAEGEEEADREEADMERAVVYTTEIRWTKPLITKGGDV